MAVTLGGTPAARTFNFAFSGLKGETGASGGGSDLTAVSPLSIENGEISVDLSGYAETADLPPKLWVSPFLPTIAEYTSGSASMGKSSYPGVRAGDYVWNVLADTVASVSSVTEGTYSYDVILQGLVDFSKVRGIMATTEIDLEPGVSGSASVSMNGHSANAGTLLLNTTSGNLMRVTAKATPGNGSAAKATVSAVGLANIFNANVSGGGTSYTASLPLSIDANNEISIDLSAYAQASALSSYAALSGATFTGAVSGVTPTANAHFATKAYVDSAIAALTNLDTETF